MECETCCYMLITECRRWPPTDKGFPVTRESSWCGEYKAKEVVIPCPVVEKAKVEVKAEARVEEKASDKYPVFNKGKIKK